MRNYVFSLLEKGTISRKLLRTVKPDFVLLKPILILYSDPGIPVNCQETLTRQRDIITWDMEIVSSVTAMDYCV